MKTAGRENPNHGVALHHNRANGAVGQNRSRSTEWAAKQEKLQPQEMCFFLTSPFIELLRTWQTEHIKVGRIIRALLPRTPIILVTLYGETLAFLDLKALGISALFSKSDPLDSASTHRP
jgi:hypothetical protein